MKAQFPAASSKSFSSMTRFRRFRSGRWSSRRLRLLGCELAFSHKLKPMKLILLVEDDPLRAKRIQACIPKGARCIWARSAGVAIGVLKRDTFVCVLLDHDLEKEPYNSGLNGQAVAQAISEAQSRKTCRIFIHSQNSIRGAAMRQLLSEA